jgi:hypothetical protein
MIQYITEHYVEIFAIIGAVLTVANLIARLTPSKKDDTIVEVIRRRFEQISNLFLPNIK